MTSIKKTSPSQKERELYYNANSDTSRSRVLTSTGQELVQYREDASIRIWFNDIPNDFAPHWHSALEIIVPMENWYDATIGETTYHAVPGDIMLIPPGEIHALRAPKTGNRFIFLFDLSGFARLHGFAAIQPLLTKPMHITRKDYPNIYDDVYQILIQMRNEYFSKSEFADLTIYSLLLGFFVKLGTNHLKTIDMITNARIPKQKEYVEKFNKVMDYIDFHYMEELDLETIAKSIGFSKYHFSRLFKQYTNYTFCSYICHRRIKVAEELLEQRDLSITEVALQSGFPSISTFNRLFKQVKGCTPSEYRGKKQLL